MGELYGEVNKLTLEWKDGLMATNVRHCCKVSTAANNMNVVMRCHHRIQLRTISG